MMRLKVPLDSPHLRGLISKIPTSASEGTYFKHLNRSKDHKWKIRKVPS